MFFSLLIVNKSGGLIFHKYLSSSTSNSVTTNELLRIGSTFHGLNAITSQIAPIMVTHSYIVTLYDLDNIFGVLYVVLEYGHSVRRDEHLHTEVLAHSDWYSSNHSPIPLIFSRVSELINS